MEWQPDNLMNLSSKRRSYKRMRELKGLNSKSEKIRGISRESKIYDMINVCRGKLTANEQQNQTSMK